MVFAIRWHEEPQLLKPVLCRACGLQQEKPLQPEAYTPQLESSLHLPTRESPRAATESPMHCNEDPVQPKMKKKIFFKKSYQGSHSIWLPWNRKIQHITSVIVIIMQTLVGSKYTYKLKYNVKFILRLMLLNI